MPLNEKQRDEFYELCQKKIEKLKITVVDREDVNFSSKVHFIDDHAIELVLKRNKGEVPAIRAKDKLDFSAVLSNGQQLLCYLKVVQVQISDDSARPSILKCDWPDNYVKKQLRQDVRIRAALKIYYSDKLDEETLKLPENDHRVGVLADISRGGSFVVTKETPVYKGQDIFIYIYINDKKVKINTIIQSKVVIVKQVGKGKDAKCQGMAVSFENLSKATEDGIVAWIFEQQRLQLQQRKTQQK